MTCSLTGCGDEVPKVTTVNDIVGTYRGTLNIVGLPDSEAEVAYVVLTKKSDSSVSWAIESEGWGIETPTYNLSCTFTTGAVLMESETRYNLTSNWIDNTLTSEFTMDDIRFKFVGKKN